MDDFGSTIISYRLINILKKNNIIKDRYRLEKELGKGSMGVVWEAFDEVLDVPVAIKFLPDHLLSLPEAIDRIKREARLCIELSHPNIVKVYTYDEYEGVPFIVMEKVGNGDTLYQLIRKKGRFTPEEVLKFLKPLSDALQYAHQKGILHRDLKPQNILLTQDLVPKISDFGLGKRIRDGLTSVSGGIFKGTYLYAPPELIEVKKIGPFSDIYSLGMIVYEMLSGRHPYKGLEFLQVYHLILNSDLEDIKGVSKEVNKVIKKALSKDPQNRYQSVKKFFEEFEIATKGLSISSVIDVASLKKEKSGNIWKEFINFLKKPKPKIWKDPYLGIEFVYVPGGVFEMGDVFGDGRDNEKPVHEVELDDFWMGRYPVTVGQWKRFVEETGYKTNAEKRRSRKYWKNPGFSQDDDHPVVCVSWNDAKEFAKWLSENTGYLFRLPTEAEWEYSARSCGKKVKYATATGEISYDLANYHYDKHPKWKHTSPVGSFPPNPLGLYDMCGNVWEWCEDVYKSYAYKHHSPRNPIYTSGPFIYKIHKGIKIPLEPSHVIRGGSYSSKPIEVRCTYRSSHLPDHSCNDVGFRLLLKK